MNRQGFIGASDVAAIMGVSEYGKSAQDLYNEKLGLTEQKPMTPQMEFGLDFENIIMKRYAKDQNISDVWEPVWDTSDQQKWIHWQDSKYDCIQNEFGTGLIIHPSLYEHKDYPFFCCHPDAVVNGKLIEAKTANQFSAYFKDMALPNDWILQAIAEMMITGIEVVEFIIFNTTTLEYQPVFELTPFYLESQGFDYQRTTGSILAKVIEFWDAIQNKTMTITEPAKIKVVRPPQIKELKGPQVNDLAKKWIAFDDGKKKLESKLNDIKLGFKNIMITEKITTILTDEYKINLSSNDAIQRPRRRDVDGN